MIPVVFINCQSVPFPLPADAVRHGRVWTEYRNEVKTL